MLNIKKKACGKELVLNLEGRLDTLSSPDLEKVLKEELDDVTDLTIDMKNLEYISSAGLRVLLYGQKRMRTEGSMRIKNVNETIQEIFEVTGFNDILTIE
ncbi:MAG: STAS domain-containing protein [Lachnospiraceae bacterium]|nr:STAS domain-containing protein [Lachnospiraceae bacterium]